MTYKLLNQKDLGYRIKSKDIEKSTSLNLLISDLLLSKKECLIWLLSNKRIDNEGYYVLLPLAANYTGIGSLDIRDKILIQDPINKKGPYILNKENKFAKEDLTGCREARILEEHIAGDKIDFRRFYLIDEDTQEVFIELKNRGYSFNE